MPKSLDITVPDLTARLALVTGASDGVGFEIASRLARAGAEVIMPVAEPREGRSRGEAYPRADAGCRHPRASPRSGVTGIGGISRGRPSLGRAPDRPPDQQCRRDDPALTPADRRRVRAAVRHQPPRALRPHRPPAAAAARGTSACHQPGERRRERGSGQLGRPRLGGALRPDEGVQLVQDRVRSLRDGAATTVGCRRVGHQKQPFAPRHHADESSRRAAGDGAFERHLRGQGHPRAVAAGASSSERRRRPHFPPCSPRRARMPQADASTARGASCTSEGSRPSSRSIHDWQMKRTPAASGRSPNVSPECEVAS